MEGRREALPCGTGEYPPVRNSPWRVVMRRGRERRSWIVALRDRAGPARSKPTGDDEAVSLAPPRREEVRRNGTNPTPCCFLIILRRSPDTGASKKSSERDLHKKVQLTRLFKKGLFLTTSSHEGSRLAMMW